MTLSPPTNLTSSSKRSSRRFRPSRRRYWRVGAIVSIALVIGITTYKDSQPDLGSFDRVSIPGTIALHIGEPSGRVIYYEGDHTVRHNDLTITVTDFAGTPVRVARDDDQMIFETLGLVRGRALATFDARTAADYRVTVSGVDTGHFVVGPAVSRRTLPGVLAGLVLACLSIAAAFALWHDTRRAAPPRWAAAWPRRPR